MKHFNPAHKVRLLFFAVHWIRAEIYDFVLRNWRIVKMATTKAQRKLFFNLRSSRTRSDWMSTQEIDALASSLDVPVETVKEMESRFSSPDVPFDAQDDDNEAEFRASPAGYLQDMRYNPYLREDIKDISHALRLSGKNVIVCSSTTIAGWELDNSLICRRCIDRPCTDYRCGLLFDHYTVSPARPSEAEGRKDQERRT